MLIPLNLVISIGSLNEVVKLTPNPIPCIYLASGITVYGKANDSPNPSMNFNLSFVIMNFLDITVHINRIVNSIIPSK